MWCGIIEIMYCWIREMKQIKIILAKIKYTVHWNTKKIIKNHHILIYSFEDF